MKKQSILVSQIFVGIFCVALLAMLMAAPALAQWFAKIRALSVLVRDWILYTFYLCSVPAGIILYCLWRLLGNINREQIFISENRRILSVISWCCVSVAVLTLGGAYHYPPFIPLSIAVLFLSLIVRVVRICMCAGMILREENSLTI